MMHLFQKKLSEVRPWSILWLLVAIFGNPVYNVMAYGICHALGYYTDLSTNVTQVVVGQYVLILLIVFGLRYVVYRVIYVIRLKDQMTTVFFLEAFAERHKYQWISLITFFMWASEVEGNIAGFIFFPVTLLMTLTVTVITINRLFKMSKYLDTQRSVG
ncbi:hypothetical protein BFP72_00090 [Reichenbachiella sp. 5M10]|uniref:hypothetical protein n=1 Tax=Reichenbachiella sp. 5M10 TaxID=1889772 RepID=UPI000C14F2B1|nr:hypothetical protein [Reichenbachiella sp. 5M10]PIB33943.1 hypothetical protein BFP72_00090 [Reichenbachiella sp. 5M10]